MACIFYSVEPQIFLTQETIQENEECQYEKREVHAIFGERERERERER